MKVRALLFDLDGTLIDTEPSALRAAVACFEMWGVEFPAEEAHQVAGRTWRDFFEKFSQKYGLPVSVDEACLAATKIYVAMLHEELRIVPGSVEAVRVLAKVWRLGLVSGSTRSEIGVVGERFRVLDQFKVILGAEDYNLSKPAPEGFLSAAQALRADPATVLVFEDSQPGIEAALAAGMKVIAVTGTKPHDVSHSAAHFRIQDMRPVNVDFIRSLEALL